MAERKSLINRREFLQATVLVTGSIALSVGLDGCDDEPQAQKTVWPRYVVRRDVDELFLEVTAIGFREAQFFGRKYLKALEGYGSPRLIYRLPPQHYAEVALLVGRIPASVPNEVLSRIELFPSKSSELVFQVPAGKKIDLKTSALLDWDDFALVLPNLDKAGSPYDLDISRDEKNPVTRIELPWGIYLSPSDDLPGPEDGGVPRSDPQPRQVFKWVLSPTPGSVGSWSELWTAALTKNGPAQAPGSFEILGVRGFKRGSTVASSDKTVVQYSDDPDERIPKWLGEVEDTKFTSPIVNTERLDLATSLCRRFKLSAGKPVIIEYESNDFNSNGKSFKSCFRDGRSVEVEQYRLSSRGGSLELERKWPVDPGCGVKGWKHVAVGGRDAEARIIKAGFLYPFGIEAELIEQTVRAFVKDDEGHFVAVLVKQTFLQIPQPNRIDLDHRETPFVTISISTVRTPPLDPLENGKPAKYDTYDYFLPKIDGVPFEFEHVGIDHAGDSHKSKMPMFYVSNEALSENGLIWEAGDTWNPGRTPPNTHAIPITGDGLRTVDKEWNANSFRFAQYGAALVAVGPPLTKGDTAQRVEWVEWVRGAIGDLPSGENGKRSRPFQPRARTMKVGFEGMSHFSGEAKLSIATYRDTRFTNFPLLDPEPNAPLEIYKSNLKSDAHDSALPYLYVLEARDLLREAGVVVADSEANTRIRIRKIYYGTSNADAIPDALFGRINNEIQFGISSTSESTGGLCVPDTHVSTLTRKFGPVGDATFNVGRWDGYANKKQRLAETKRLDYAAYRVAFRAEIDKDPYDKSLTASDLDGLRSSATNLMGFPAPAAVGALAVAVPASAQSTGLNLGDLFGSGAEILPGLSFKDLFAAIPVRDAALGSNNSDAANPQLVGATRSAEPLQWNFKITGIDWLLQAIGNEPGQISWKDLIEFARTQSPAADTSIPIDLGAEATLHWINESFSDTVDLGAVVFQRLENDGKSTRMEIHARAKTSLGLDGLPENLSELKMPPGKAEVTATAALTDFVVTVFSAVEIEFADVTFALAADGGKKLSTNIRDVRLKGPLEFLNQLSKMLGGLGKDSGIDVAVSFSGVKISQTLKYPPNDKEVLYLGPAQVTNLALGWALSIPFTGRDLLSLSFALSSREKPLTIFVPPWYGGKAHILLEVTTQGIRLLEIAMEYGALIPIHWGIASGEASLTAGVFYSVENSQDKHVGRVVFQAFVRAAANLDVAGIIHFCGQIFIALSYQQDNQRRLIVGQASVSVSIKIGFVRFSYSFSATHVEEAHNEGTQARSFPWGEERYAAGGGPRMLEDMFVRYDDADDERKCPPRSLPGGTFGDARVFRSDLTDPRRDAFLRLVKSYVN